MLVWELIGAAVGAGFASGRETAVFFAQYGKWGYAGLAAAGIMLLLAGEPLPASWQSRWMEKVWQVLLSLLLIATGGAMLAGAGEIWARTLPITWSYWMGIAATTAIGWILAVRTKSGLAWVSRGLLGVLAVQLVLAFTVQPMKGAVLTDSKWHAAVFSGASYGGFNAALQWPIMAAVALENKQKKRAVRWAAILILLLLWLGMLLMQRNAALLGESMPFLMMMKRFGATGYSSFILCLYLAILSTLTACIRAVKGRMLPVAGIVLTSCAGFGSVVNFLYPFLGGGCCIMLLFAKMMNSFAGSFHSRKDMI